MTEGTEVLACVGANVRRLRAASGLSQSELATAAGVSRRTIVNLEAGSANIGLSSLDTIADALGVTFVDLVLAPAATPDHIDALMWRGNGADSRAVLLGSAAAHQEGQLWVWSLGVDDRYDANPDPAGWHEMVLVIAGRLRIERESGDVTLGLGDHAIYSSAQQYAYINAGSEVTRFVRVVLS
ncbi:helix-turn-helix domain-containing protein [Mycolicibacterium brisbanense]